MSDKFNLVKPEANISKSDCLVKASLWLELALIREQSTIYTQKEINSTFNVATEFEDMAFDGRR